MEEKATGRRKRGRKPKEPDANVDPTVRPDDSGIMKTRRGWVQGYNAQAVVTPDQIILAAEVTTEANDVRQLTGMLNQAQANVAAVMGEDAALGAAVADAGYWAEANAASQTEECELFIATQKDRKQRAALREAPAPRGRMPRSMTARERCAPSAVAPRRSQLAQTAPGVCLPQQASFRACAPPSNASLLIQRQPPRSQSFP